MKGAEVNRTKGGRIELKKLKKKSQVNRQLNRHGQE